MEGKCTNLWGVCESVPRLLARIVAMLMEDSLVWLGLSQDPSNSGKEVVVCPSYTKPLYIFKFRMLGDRKLIINFLSQWTGYNSSWNISEGEQPYCQGCCCPGLCTIPCRKGALLI